MIRRKLNTEKCGCCCTLKEKLQYLWEHTMGAILKVNDITPDGDGKFTIQAGTNIALTEISNGLRIDTTGGVSYYTPGDTYVDVDNNDLEISLKNPGQTDGVALHNDLEVVAQSVTNILTDLTPSVTYLTPRNDLTGLTIEPANNNPNACSLVTYGKVAVLNISIKITGTRSGQSDWYHLFPNLDMTQYYYPYLVSANTTSNLLNGDLFFVNNGQTYNEYVNRQIILIHI